MSDSVQILITLNGSTTDGSFTTAVSNSFFSPFRKKIPAADSGQFRVIFFYILKIVYCVYSLESPQRGDSNANTQHTFM